MSIGELPTLTSAMTHEADAPPPRRRQGVSDQEILLRSLRLALPVSASTRPRTSCSFAEPRNDDANARGALRCCRPRRCRFVALGETHVQHDSTLGCVDLDGWFGGLQGRDDVASVDRVTHGDVPLDGRRS